jgi:dihydrofolate reductase
MSTATGFKLPLAVSDDGFLARGPKDDMKWTGATDKAVFRLLTLSGGELLAGRTTAEQMPPLPGRKLITLSRQHHLGITLAEAAWVHRDAWLIGGPAIAEEALRANLVDRMFLCRVPVSLGDGIPFSRLQALLPDVCTYRQLVGPNPPGYYVDVYTGLQSRGA